MLIRPWWAAPQPGLPHPRVQPEIAHQLLRAVEPADVADRRHDSGGDRQIHAGRHQSVHRGILDRVPRDLAVEQDQVFGQPVKLTDMPIDGRALIIRQLLSGQPCPAAGVEKIGMRALRDQVRVQDRMHLVLELRTVPHDLVAPCHQPTLALGLRIRRPDLRQVSRRLQIGERAGIDLVGSEFRWRNASGLQQGSKLGRETMQSRGLATGI
ncbi:hypothetical protein ABIA00_000040 [Bradyrhizobium ottawaense]